MSAHPPPGCTDNLVVLSVHAVLTFFVISKYMNMYLCTVHSRVTVVCFLSHPWLDNQAVTMVTGHLHALITLPCIAMST